MDEPVVNSQEEARVAGEAGHPIVRANIVLGMTCRLCGPIPYPLDSILLVEDAKRYQEMHWRWHHPGIQMHLDDGQHRVDSLGSSRSYLQKSNTEEN